MSYIQLSYCFNLEQLFDVHFMTLTFLNCTGYLFCSMSFSGCFLIKLYFMFECFILPKYQASLIMKKGMRSKSPKWRWGRDTVARSAVLGTLTAWSGHVVGSWLGRMQLDSSLPVVYLVIGDINALCVIISPFVLLCV